MHRKLLLAALALVLAGASASVLAAAAAPPTPTKAPEVRIVTTEGDIVVQLDPKRAPITVKNFLAYVHSGFYDGTMKMESQGPRNRREFLKNMAVLGGAALAAGTLRDALAQGT
ncbi:MAG: peptidylprolyl isomerase, partial [Gammaproteobacteria bacterium]